MDELLQASDRDSLRRRTAWISLAGGFIVLLLKWAGFIATGSAAILSDAMESVVHVAAAAFLVYSARLLSEPPDENHPYGHGKVEHLAIGFEGGIILFAALAVIREAVEALWHGSQLHSLNQGLAVIVAATLMNLLLGLYLLFTARGARSALLKANGLHVLTDCATSAGVIVGLLLVKFTGIVYLDPLLAIIIAFQMIWAGEQLVRQSVRGLMDEADPKLLALVVKAVNEIRAPDWFDMHNLRAINHGGTSHMDFHLVVPPHWTVGQAHAVMNRLEEHILSSLDRPGSVMIHLDPYLDEKLRRLVRADGGSLSAPFTLESATRFVPEDMGEVSSGIAPGASPAV